jgi:ferrous iron transport protein A
MTKSIPPNDATLADLALSQSGIVTALTCAGAQRDRMMDLGVLPGTRITAEMRGPMGDPTAYRIRGALIALRREQAESIHISIESDPSISQRESVFTGNTGQRPSNGRISQEPPS